MTIEMIWMGYDWAEDAGIIHSPTLEPAINCETAAVFLHELHKLDLVVEEEAEENDGDKQQ